MPDTARPCRAAEPVERPWPCARCGETIAYLRGRTVLLLDGQRFIHCVRAEVRCPFCRTLNGRWLGRRR